jgi:hypothetical protein
MSIRGYLFALCVFSIDAVSSWRWGRAGGGESGLRREDSLSNARASHFAVRAADMPDALKQDKLDYDKYRRIRFAA